MVVDIATRKPTKRCYIKALPKQTVAAMNHLERVLCNASPLEETAEANPGKAN